MSDLKLSTLAVILGLLVALPSLLGLIKPKVFADAARKFPRCTPVGYFLVLLGTAWFLYYVHEESVADFASLKTKFYFVFSAVGIGTCIFVRDFLPVRGLAVVFLLLAKLMVDTARLEETDWRLVICCWAYLLVLAGMWFTISPWRLRDLLNWSVATESRTRLTSGLRVAFGLFVVVLGLTVFKTAEQKALNHQASLTGLDRPVVSRGRILVIRGGAIGDFILTLPALAALRKQFPQTHLAVLGYPRVAALAELAGSANEIRSIEARALAGYFARRGELDAALGEWFAGFNIIVSYLYDPDGIFQENVQRVFKAQFLAGIHRPDESQNLHATEVFLKPLERLAIFDADPTPRLSLGISPDAPPVIALHPGSGGERKNWPEEHWRELLRRIAAETNWRLLLVGGEAEGERIQRLAPQLPVGRSEIAVNEPLPALARKFAACTGFLGHDSGITHLAAASGLGGLALWGATKPEIWRPRSERFALLRAEHGLEKMEPARVLASVSAMMARPRSADGAAF